MSRLDNAGIGFSLFGELSRGQVPRHSPSQDYLTFLVWDLRDSLSSAIALQKTKIEVSEIYSKCLWMQRLHHQF